MRRRSCASSAARWSRPGTASALACDQSEFGATQRAAQRRGPEFGTASATEVLLGLWQNGLAGGLARPSPRFGVTWPPGEVRGATHTVWEAEAAPYFKFGSLIISHTLPASFFFAPQLLKIPDRSDLVDIRRSRG
jgi:hypothetical protein